MGLRFCNEAVMCLKQIYPPMSDKHENEALTPLQVRVVVHGSPITLFLATLYNPIFTSVIPS